ncbi:hypothetical protein [Actinoplanes sp. NBRC 103695]|uniref:hypothetical protein n=1 Tax=Actinoplanes sp. NBRC 103695 TaxID=3032202 RepID=UPI0024A463D0|nr:hypothetical protein [Actinoplanes sp. NBRC 103695]GLZ00944.1 hypothetical protein Acsp02_81960 [Actinoplanes sp. NBRC 103695]
MAEIINSGWRRKGVIISGALLAAAMVLACSSGNTDTGETAKGDAAVAADAPSKAGGPEGVYKFGQTVKFRDGSTLTVGKPAKFKRAEFAVGGEKKAVHLKFKATFKNNTDEVFDPALTTAAVSAGGEEGESIFQEGLDAPDNKVLPGKSVTWWMGYGVPNQKDLQLEVNVGFLDYGTVIFTI